MEEKVITCLQCLRDSDEGVFGRCTSCIKETIDYTKEIKCHQCTVSEFLRKIVNPDSGLPEWQQIYEYLINSDTRPFPDVLIRVLVRNLGKSQDSKHWKSFLTRFFENKTCTQNDDGKMFVFTPEQMKKIEELISANFGSRGLNHNLEKMLVKRAKYPWDCSIEFLNTGVCYFGNLGEKPRSHDIAYAIVARNLGI